jgi:hypothetical protein
VRTCQPSVPTFWTGHEPFHQPTHPLPAQERSHRAGAPCGTLASSTVMKCEEVPARRSGPPTWNRTAALGHGAGYAGARDPDWHAGATRTRVAHICVDSNASSDQAVDWDQCQKEPRPEDVRWWVINIMGCSVAPEFLISIDHDQIDSCSQSGLGAAHTDQPSERPEQQRWAQPRSAPRAADPPAR